MFKISLSMLWQKGKWRRREHNGTVLCSISEFFHKSKICYSCKNVLLFVCILKGNSYFYLLCQFSAVCLLGNNNLFTFSKHFYHFCSKKYRQIPPKSNQIVRINHICSKKTLENVYFEKKFQSLPVGFEPAAPQITQI